MLGFRVVDVRVQRCRCRLRHDPKTDPLPDTDDEGVDVCPRSRVRHDMLGRLKRLVRNVGDRAGRVTGADIDRPLIVAIPRLSEFNGDLVLLLQRVGERFLCFRYRVVNDSGQNRVTTTTGTDAR